MKSLLRYSIVLASFTSLMLAAVPAFAAEPAEVAQAIRDDGVYVESGSDLSESDAGDLVAIGRNQGERLSIVVLTDDPGGGAVAFGDAVVDRLGSDPGLIFVLTPDDVGVAGIGDVYSLAEIDGALDAAVDAGGSDTDYVTNFVEALTGVASPAAEASSGSGAGLLWLILIIAGIGLFLFWMVRRSKHRRELSTENELASARAEIQLQIDAIANDLLDLEDEVRVADDDGVDELYNAAGQTYRDASDALGKADTAAEFLDITNDLETAIWQLDSAEALLDGNRPPPRPEPKRLEPVAAPQTDSSGGSLGVPPRPSYPKSGYTRRPTRRSSGMSPNLIEMLITLGAGALSSRSRGRAAARTTPSRRPTRTTRSGGGFLPSPSRKSTSSKPASRSSRSSTRSSRSSRGSTGGRIRTGRRRRK